jgi:hypothetical protein
MTAQGFPDVRRIAAAQRHLADELDPPPPPGEPTDADVIVGLHSIDFDHAEPGSPADNLGKLRGHPDWPEVRQVLAARGMRLSTNGRGPVNEISALARIRDIVKDLGPAGLDAALALLRPFAGEGIAKGRKIDGRDLTNAHEAVAAMMRDLL